MCRRGDLGLLQHLLTGPAATVHAARRPSARPRGDPLAAGEEPGAWTIRPNLEQEPNVKLPLANNPDYLFAAAGAGNRLAPQRGVTPAAVHPQGCSIWKKIGCAAALAACAASCVITGPECVGCFAALGASSCIDCL